ncbi:FixH family protein [Maritalea sp.]|uniref:FixH family protein n=1 Tax=Maritalea sp. TaxID=2003361 RepID=UPI003EF77881
MSQLDQPKQREFTGKHMILVVGLFFGTIITVNLIMAYFATSSWTGLVVKNSYVASQGFNEKLAARRTQDALGWTPNLTYQNGTITYRLENDQGEAIKAGFAEAELKRPSHEREDQLITLLPKEGAYSADYALGSGAWDIFVSLTSEAGEPFTYRERIIVQ